jgi:uncharacterized protein YutE (UPF0331/DUF86 family)
MELDKEKIFNKIQIIEENLKKLLQLRMLSLNDFAADFRNVESAKHLLQTAVEAMIDITTHTCEVSTADACHQRGGNEAPGWKRHHSF